MNNSIYNLLRQLLGIGVLLSLSVPVFSQRYEQDLQALAKTIANLSNQDVAFRNFIKQRALEQFDGDYEFLIKDHLDHNFEGGQTLQQKIMGESLNPQGTLNFINNNLQLQIAVPVLIEEWDTDYAPVVAYLDEEFSEEMTSVKAFDSRGTLIDLSISEDPIYPVIVVSKSERVDENGNLFEITGGGGSEAGNPPPCNGPDGAWEYVNQLKVSNMGAIEHWILGKPEIRVVARTVNNDPLGGQNGKMLVPSSRKAINKKWFTFNASMFRWYNQLSGIPQVGPVCIFYLTEYDGGQLAQVPITVAIPPVTISITVPIWNNDEIIGDQIVYFEDCNYFEYNLGSVQMKLKRQ